MAVVQIHTADWRLGKQFAKFVGDVCAALRDQRIKTVKAIAQLASNRKANSIFRQGLLMRPRGQSASSQRISISARRLVLNDAEIFATGAIEPGNSDSR